LDHTTQAAYRDLLQQLRALGFPFLWRIWNYFPGINDEQAGLERYRRFCIGRHQALAGSLTDFPDSLPAGTAVGTRSGHLQIYALAGTRPVTHLGNPRQVDAYDYPISYGPCSPSFARATVYRSDSHAQLFIAGTASIVGHESQHRGLPDQQSRETVVNLHALIDHAEHFQPSVEGNRQHRSFLKVYVRNLEHLDSIRNALQDPLLLSSQVLFLQGDLCRRELLVEIEGLITRD
jgi:chorismate lyase/3-hydroxybenzoate synthase